MAEAKVVAIPMEMSKVIPKFDGDEKLLNLFIKKCEYVISCYKQESHPQQDLYIFHVLSSKLVGKAAHLMSERQDIETWPELKAVLIQHFGDPRSEECIAIELETLKINPNESYLDFCNRIQQVKSTLIAKVNIIPDPHIRQSKITIYDNLSMNVFLYNLPEDLIRIVRLKGSRTLEEALTIVLEEVNFQYQYNARNKMFRTVNKPQQSSSQNPYIEKFGLKQFHTNNNPQLNQGFRFGTPNQPRPNHPQNLNSGMPQAPQFKFGIPNTTPQGFRPQINQPQQNFKFGIPNQNVRQNFSAPQGYRPNFNAHQGYRPNFGQQQTNQFKFGIPGKPHNTDVTMRTALPLPRPNPAFHNEIEVYEDNYNYYNYDTDMNYDHDPYADQSQINTYEPTDNYNDQEQYTESNFYNRASDTTLK